MEKCINCKNEGNNLIAIARKGAKNSDSVTTQYICAECLAKSYEYKECYQCSEFGDNLAYHIEDLNCIEEYGSIIYLCAECLKEHIEERKPASQEEADGINDLSEHYN